MEDAYPVAIQSAFWGVTGVDGKTVVEMDLDEPSLDDVPKIMNPIKKENEVYELSDQASDALRSLQDNDMFDNIITDNLENLDNLDLDLDLDNFDFSDLLGDDDDDTMDFPPSGKLLIRILNRC